MSVTNFIEIFLKNKISFMTNKLRKMKDILLVVVLLHSIMKSTEKA